VKGRDRFLIWTYCICDTRKPWTQKICLENIFWSKIEALWRFLPSGMLLVPTGKLLFAFGNRSRKACSSWTDWPFRWKNYDPPKRLQLFFSARDVTALKAWIMSTAVRDKSLGGVKLWHCGTLATNEYIVHPHADRWTQALHCLCSSSATEDPAIVEFCEIRNWVQLICCQSYMHTWGFQLKSELNFLELDWP
jgi:hypothetical protein